MLPTFSLSLPSLPLDDGAKWTFAAFAAAARTECKALFSSISQPLTVRPHSKREQREVRLRWPRNMFPTADLEKSISPSSFSSSYFEMSGRGDPFLLPLTQMDDEKTGRFASCFCAVNCLVYRFLAPNERNPS
jgi:hypothetical protein